MRKSQAPESERREEVCAACGSSFGCGANVASCWCSEITLTENARAELAGRFEGCLCRQCLIRFSLESPVVQSDPAP
ncbi:MAG: cysteine-rich CWC family protein [Acidobacteriota bacterium]|nr:MAG: cysteine-rich CWC family protein [Acidobacteriota bacterium]